MRPRAVEQAEQALGARAEAWRRVDSGGWSIAEHWVVTLADGRTAFVKKAVTEDLAGFLRDELHVYRSLRGAFMPELLGWHEDPLPALVLEDLSDARWVPPWQEGDVDAVLATLDDVARTPPPGRLPQLGEFRGNWSTIADDPAPFLSLGVVSADWLDASLPALRAAEEATPLEGDGLVHCDARSDNLCIRDGRAVFFDWNWASVGNPVFDVAFWLPSLELEGGARLLEMQRRVPAVAEFAALVAGFFAGRAGLAPPAGAPQVRGFQLVQAELALPWAVDVLGLPPLDGPRWNGRGLP